MLLLCIVFVRYGHVSVCVLCYPVCSLQHCGHLLRKGWPLGCCVRCVLLCFVAYPKVSLSTPELRASLALCPPVKVFLLTVPRWSFLWTILLFIFRVCLVFLSVHCNLVVTCWERTDLLALLYAMFYCVMWCPGSGVVLNCIESWSLFSFLLLFLKTFLTLHYVLAFQARFRMFTISLFVTYTSTVGQNFVKQ